MYDSKNNFNDDFLRYQTRGYCPVDEKKNEAIAQKNKANETEITIDNFNLNKCNQTDSNGGYSKNDLKKFATKYLDFNDADIEGKKKSILCQMIGERISNMRSKSDVNDKSLLDIYKKDPKSCDKGESGGGYYLGILRKMASRYFGMDPEIAKDASKKYLCDFIVPILDKEILKKEKEKKPENVVLSSIYVKNPNYCEEGPRKGGYGLKELKEMGVKYFGIDPELNNKEQICKIIRDKLGEEMKKSEIIGNFKNIDVSDEPSDETFSFFDKLKSSKKISKTHKKRSRFLKYLSDQKSKLKK